MQNTSHCEQICAPLTNPCSGVMNWCDVHPRRSFDWSCYWIYDVSNPSFIIILIVSKLFAHLPKRPRIGGEETIQCHSRSEPVKQVRRQISNVSSRSIQRTELTSQPNDPPTFSVASISLPNLTLEWPPDSILKIELLDHMLWRRSNSTYLPRDWEVWVQQKEFCVLLVCPC